MKFRTYCIVVMGKTDDVISEIVKISETKPNVLDAKGVLIATFLSIAEIKELNDYFKSNDRNFLIFDLNPDYSGFNINKKEIHEGLFGFLNEYTEDTLRQKENELFVQLTSTTVDTKIVKNEEVISITDIENMTLEDKNNLMNELLDKGIQNLSEYDKRLLDKLSN